MAQILVVDDDAALGRMVALMLRSADHQVAVFDDGRTALEAALANPPDVMLTDIRMPGLNGLQIIRSLRAAGTKTKIVAMSGGGDHEEGLTAALRLGAVASIAKPFRQHKLLGLIDILAADLAANADACEQQARV